MSSLRLPVSAFDEWTQLREVVVGHTRHYPVPTAATGTGRARLPADRRTADELGEDLRALGHALSDCGVTVVRPAAPRQETGPLSSYWNPRATPPVSIRDAMLVLGTTIVESSPHVRARDDEGDPYLTDLVYDYYAAGSPWLSMPLPVNGSQFIRLGHDILATATGHHHARTLRWLQRNTSGLRFHPITTDSPLDSVVLPLRPGLMLLRSLRYLPCLPQAMRSWDVLHPPPSMTGPFPVLSVNEHTVIAAAHHRELITLLEKQRGLTVLPVRHRHHRFGDLRCLTLDTIRTGGREDYLT
ncbi:glycine amidinotransferase [Streptomyces amakusaensis]|uniref:Inosamine-phosphate amidinotransferase 1 n=1 Tax=Streptomyces amakusaensis TaxID=67271 RepID=A0ABW0AK30_9ACTN